MILLRILNGKHPGREWIGRKFPVHIGRDHSANLKLEEEGVWDGHAAIRFTSEGYFLDSRAEASTWVEGVPVRSQRLLNGQEVRFGGLRTQFWLANPGQRWLNFWQWFSWGLVLLCGAAQLIAFYLTLG